MQPFLFARKAVARIAVFLIFSHLNISSRRNVAVSPSQVSQNGIWVCHFGINARSHAITGFLAVYFPLNPFQPSHFGTLSPIYYLPVRILQNPSKSSLSRVFAVSPSFNQALAQIMLYTVRRLSFRLDREIDASNYPSRGRRRRHCSVMPAAPLRRGMEGGKERPCTYNGPMNLWCWFRD